MKDTIKLRTAVLALSENLKSDTVDPVVVNVTKIKVSIDIVSTLPMLTMTDALVANSLMAEDHRPSLPATLDIDNTLKDVGYLDETGNERFTFITIASSAITNNKVRLYHDAKYSDIIVIPELNCIDNTINDTLYELRGYRVGGGCNVDDINNDLIVPGDETFKLPLTNSNIANTSKHVKMHGIARDTDGGHYYKTLDNGDMVVNRKLTTVGMVNLGSGDELFVDAGARVPMYTIVQATLDRYALKFLGNIQPKNIYIPLNF